MSKPKLTTLFQERRRHDHSDLSSDPLCDAFQVRDDEEQRAAVGMAERSLYSSKPGSKVVPEAKTGVKHLLKIVL